MMLAYDFQLYTFVLTIKLGNKVYNKISIEILTVNSYWPCREFFMKMSFLHNILRLFRIGDAFGKRS